MGVSVCLCVHVFTYPNINAPPWETLVGHFSDSIYVSQNVIIKPLPFHKCYLIRKLDFGVITEMYAQMQLSVENHIL